MDLGAALAFALGLGPPPRTLGAFEDELDDFIPLRCDGRESWILGGRESHIHDTGQSKITTLADIYDF